MNVLVVGDIVTDVLAIHSGPLAAGSDTPARITLTGGGSAANTAAWLAWLGTPVTLAGVVGADDAGAALIAQLTHGGVRCAVRRTPELATGSVVVLSIGTERTMLCDRGANGLLAAADVAAALDGTTHLHLSGYPLLDPGTAAVGRFALAEARRRAITTSVDAASAEPVRRVGGATFLSWIRGTDLLLTNVDECRALLGLDAPPPGIGSSTVEDLAMRLTRSVARAVVKRGADGATWADADGSLVSAPAQPATAVDPTGAGDAFAAGLLAAWLADAAPEAALRAGTRLGARAVAVVGGRPPPDRGVG
jgi:ribokinase